MMEELADIGNMFGDLLSGGLGPSNNDITKQRNKEMVYLNKKEPQQIKVETTTKKTKNVAFHTKVPKEKAQKFINHHTNMKKDET